jgi:hypothetical protein
MPSTVDSLLLGEKRNQNQFEHNKILIINHTPRHCSTIYTEGEGSPIRAAVG